MLSRSKLAKEQEQLAYSFAPKLYRLALARLANREDAEDAVQETYVKAFSSFDKFKPGSNMDSWLTTILLNVLRDHIRKISKSGKTLSLDGVVAETESLPDQLVDNKSPQAILEEREVSLELLQALRELPEFFLIPLLLRDLNDFTYKEIASLLDIPMGTVMSRLARARESLKQRLFGGSKSGQKRQLVKDPEKPKNESNREDQL